MDRIGTAAGEAETEGMYRIRVPMGPPLLEMNGYLFLGQDGMADIVDPGPGTAEAQQVWETAFAELGLTYGSIRSIVVTHHHPDHFGLAGRLQERSGCTVLMSARAYKDAELMWGRGGTMERELPALFAEHGMPDEWTIRIEGHLAGFHGQVNPFPSPIFLADGEIITLGDRQWTAVETGGHAAGHLSLYHAAERIMLCGDAVLPLISPNVSFVPGGDPSPLNSFIGSLNKLRAYPVTMAYPGHRRPFAGFAARIDGLLEHHEERLDELEELIQSGMDSGYALCLKLFGTRIQNAHTLRFAMGETLAHLIELAERGRIKQETTAHGLKKWSVR